jgi:hypothetical protein
MLNDHILREKELVGARYSQALESLRTEFKFWFSHLLPWISWASSVISPKGGVFST